MSTGYELNGRVAQKRRTREALIEAARQLIAKGGAVPTIEAVAEAASTSRTTAYRYFPSQRALLVAAHPETALESLLPDDAPDDDVAARLDMAIDAFTRSIVSNEPQARTVLRLSLEADPEERSQLALRQGRAINWIEQALAPLRPGMSPADVHRLAVAIRSATGIEALVWLTDVAGLSRDDATQLMRWSAHAMLTTALLERTARAPKQRSKRTHAPGRS